MSKWLKQLLFDWVYVLLYSLFQGFLNLVNLIESFFDIFAGTAKVLYKGNSEFLISIFFGHSAVTNAFWAMALIAIVLAFGFCIVQVSRKAADVTGSVKQSVGQIMSNFFRCMLIILLLNLVTVAVINITNVLLDRINYALKNAAVLNQQEQDKTFSDQEYAVMTRILATVANYSVNPSADSRYNVNSCFNAIRPDLLSLYVNGFFNYDYLPDANGHYTWQGALALLASSADLTTDLKLDVLYADVLNAFQVVSRELSTYRDFAPVETAHFSVADSIDTDVLIFLIAGMEASQNSMYNTGNFNDALRKGYISGDKSYNNLKQVRKDFDIWKMDYLVGYISCVVFIIIMAICIFTFIVRMFNLLLLYLTAPLFASSMPMDDGGKWQSWTQAFVIQLFSGFGMVVAMRLYLIIIPIIISSDLVFFAGNGLGYAVLNRTAQLLMVLGGAWAVLQSGGVITGIMAGNPGMAAIQQEGQIGAKVTGWAMRAPRAALGAAKGIMGAPMKAAKGIEGMRNKIEQGQQKKVERLDRKAQQRQNQADALYDQANKRIQEGKHDRATRGLMDRASEAQVRADHAKAKAVDKRAAYGLGAYQSERSYRGVGSSSMPKEPDRPSVPPRATPVSASGGSGSSGGSGGSGGFTGTPRRLGEGGGAARTEGRGIPVSAKQPPPPRSREQTPSAPAGAAGGASKISGGRQMPPPPPPPPNPNGARARAAAVQTPSGGGVTATASGENKSFGGRQMPPPPPIPNGARARAAASQTSDTSGSTPPPPPAAAGGEGKSFGGRQMPPPSPIPTGMRARAAASQTSDAGGSTPPPPPAAAGGEGKSFGGRQMPPPPLIPNGARARAAASQTSDAGGFTGSGSTLGGSTPAAPPPPSGGFTGTGRSVGGSTPPPPPPPRRILPKTDGGKDGDNSSPPPRKR